MPEPRDPEDQSAARRRALQSDAFTGFLGFFAFLAFIQAVVNVLSPDPAVWPAVLALVLVTLTVISWRRGRRNA